MMKIRNNANTSQQLNRRRQLLASAAFTMATTPLLAQAQFTDAEAAEIAASCKTIVGTSGATGDSVYTDEQRQACTEFLQHYQTDDSSVAESSVAESRAAKPTVEKATAEKSSAARSTAAKSAVEETTAEPTQTSAPQPASLATAAFNGNGDPTTFLLKPRSLELGLGLSYSSSSKASALRANSSRDYSMPLSLKLGLGRAFELSASIPLKSRVSEVITTDGTYSQTATGEGDISVGLTYQLREGHASFPDTSVSLNFGIPTDSDTSPLAPNQIRLGSAYHSTSVGIAMVKASDPAVLFGSLTYRLVDEEQFGDVAIQPGASLSLSFGVGFSINSAITLTALVNNEHVGDTRYNGELIEGTGSEAIALATGLDYRLSNKQRLEFAVDYGLNDVADGVGFSVQYIYNLIR